MEEARAVLLRLDRIERLDRAHAPAAALLAELRALVDEADAWARREHAGADVVERCRAALEGAEVAAGPR
jgi:hypothetical protein